ncbi:hypothetical protein [Zavarzinella formosa]|uniref:hypothetical protein n=1 Tax=Zavarzinella formosa TaxID=360055 RepID=UPI0002E2A2EF|nr:hypothetical protein [Zavarzinella formosa]
MMEIVVLFRLGRSIAAKASQHGRQPILAVLLLIGLWFGGEFLGGLIGFVVSYVLFEARESNLLFIYGTALGGAMLGAVMAFRLTGRQTNVTPEESGPPDAHIGGLPKFPE